MAKGVRKNAEPLEEDGDDYEVLRLHPFAEARVPARVMIGGHDVLIGFYDTQSEAIAAIREAQARLKR